MTTAVNPSKVEYDENNPFTWNAPAFGQQWQLPSISDLPPIMDGEGFGCFVAPNASVGYKIENTQLECTSGYWCPYINQSDPNQQMVACPPSSECALTKLYSGTCLPQGRYEPVPCLAGWYCPNPKVILPW
jgi:hypothetical protein